MILDIPSKGALRAIDRRPIQKFLQGMVNRLCFGHIRYGPPSKAKQYAKRLGLEYVAYKKTGNAEHLMNIANYALLETIAPSHPKFHLNAEADSATRGKL